VAFAGVGPVVPVTRVIAKEVFAGVDDFTVVPGEGSILFIHDHPGPGSRRRLEEHLVGLELTPGQGAHLVRVPGGYRLDLPPGTIVGRCPRREASCVPRDFRGAWAGAPWLTGWIRWPAEEGTPPSGHLSGLLPHLRDVVHGLKTPDSFNQ
jgi:hypothetical protein